MCGSSGDSDSGNGADRSASGDPASGGFGGTVEGGGLGNNDTSSAERGHVANAGTGYANPAGDPTSGYSGYDVDYGFAATDIFDMFGLRTIGSKVNQARAAASSDQVGLGQGISDATGIDAGDVIGGLVGFALGGLPGAIIGTQFTDTLAQMGKNPVSAALGLGGVAMGSALGPLGSALGANSTVNAAGNMFSSFDLDPSHVSDFSDFGGQDAADASTIGAEGSVFDGRDVGSSFGSFRVGRSATPQTEQETEQETRSDGRVSSLLSESVSRKYAAKRALEKTEDLFTLLEEEDENGLEQFGY